MNTSSSPVFSYPMSPTDVPLSSAPLKIVLLLLTGISVHYSLTPPHTAAPKTVVANKTLFERGILWVTWCSKTLVLIMALADSFATYLAAYHPSASFVCPHAPSTLSLSAISAPASPSLHPLLSPSPLLICGAFVSIFGNLLRQRCFWELGALFTFEVTIQPEHTLITTGPYSIVRHPSYTGVYLTLLGPTAMMLAPGAWVRECWFSFACSNRWTSLLSSPAGSTGFETIFGALALPTFGQTLIFSIIVFWCVKVCFALKSTNKRLGLEDQELHKVFGQAWEEYAKKVPYRLVPGVY